jgi:hypothetical protein
MAPSSVDWKAALLEMNTVGLKAVEMDKILAASKGASMAACSAVWKD